MSLDETYERILLAIDKEKREHAIRLFKCLTFSRRPLRVKELAEVFAIQFRTTIPSLNATLRPEDADKAVLSACSTLVTTLELDEEDENNDPDNRNSRVVQFSHYSVKEFLTSERLANPERRDLSQYHISPEPSHTVLAQSCLSTLLQPDIHIEDITDSFPLAKYAAQNWFHHALCDGVAPRIQDGMVRLFDPDKKHLAVWVSIHNIDHVPSSYQLREPPNPPGPSPLYYATLCGIHSLVEYLVITRQQDPNESHGGWGTALHAAVVLGHTAIAKFLLEHGALVNSRDKYDSTPLHEASGSGKLDVLQLLLNHGADVNVVDHQEDYALHRAYQYQRLDAMELLVNEGADVNVRNKSKATLLHEASRNGNLDVIQFLLGHHADADALDRWGDSPLHWAFQSQKIDAMKLLIKAGADANIRNKYDSTLLHEASGSGNLDVIQLLLSVSAEVNVFDCWGDSPLHKAFRHKYAVKLLVDGGADVNIRNKSNSTPLHKASGSGNLDVIQLLLSRGAGVNALDRWGDSPFRRASQYQQFDAMKLLVDGGADLNAQNKFNSTLLHEAPGRRNPNDMQLPLSHGADVNSLDHWGDSSLHKSSRSLSFDAVGSPHKGRVKVIDDTYDWTLIPKASSGGNIDLVPPLSKKCTSAMNACDNGGPTPLHDAKSIRS